MHLYRLQSIAVSILFNHRTFKSFCFCSSDAGQASDRSQGRGSHEGKEVSSGKTSLVKTPPSIESLRLKTEEENSVKRFQVQTCISGETEFGSNTTNIFEIS